MPEPLTITLKTLTPLWTGGADGTSDRLHETGLIGSLRWWYEALVRGLGGYACDPTSDNPDARCGFDAKAYEKAKSEKRAEAEAIGEGLKTICPVCYLFGATGWARLFQLQALNIPTTTLHFRTTVRMNQGWLQRVFGGDAMDIRNLKVPHGDLLFQFITRGHDTNYTQSQFALALRLAAEYGGVGARLQHGFGQVKLYLPQEMANVMIGEELKRLAVRLRANGLRSSGPITETSFDLRNFISLTYEIAKGSLSAFTAEKVLHLGNPQKRNEENYLPCAFDLRYKGSGKWGMRRWLEDPNGTKRWNHARANQLMGVSKKKGEPDNEDDRQASRLSFGMPWRMPNGNYQLGVFGFAPPKMTPEELNNLCGEYMQHAFGVKPISVVLGKTLIHDAQGGVE